MAPEPYLPSRALIEAVNLALFLDRPLLLKGEPGCGKTRLGRHVAAELGLTCELWPIKSQSRARDGLYSYDAISRLRGAQLLAMGQLSPEERERVQRPAEYLRWGPLGRALRSPARSVVIIDEIDKADIDFPNDLLLELDERRFFIEETGEEIAVGARPVIFVTSNDEKDLPDAFLRRCLFHYIEFPGEAQLTRIVREHFPDAAPEVAEAAAARFVELREAARDKKPSTSELLDWFRVLRRYPKDEVLRKLQGQVPFLSVLLKSWSDHQDYLRRAAQADPAAAPPQAGAERA